MITAESLPVAIDLALRGTQSMVKCEAHDDGMASLHVSPGTSQPVLLHCHAGCETDAVLAAAGVDMKAILAEREAAPEAPAGTGMGRASHTYVYTDENGNPLFEVLRFPKANGKKTFRQRHRKDGKWIWNMQDVRRVLYKLPEVLKAKEEGRTIYVVEGEKDADNFAAVSGFTVTTSPMGAGKWQDSYTETLAATEVVIIADADDAGRAHARKVRDELVEVGSHVTVMEAAPGCKDISDHIEKGYGPNDLKVTIPHEEEETRSYGVDVLDLIEREISPSRFVIPNVLTRGERLLVTAFEGTGKSTWMRQVAVQVAAGIHPWTGVDIPPQTVMYIDGENKPDQVQESWAELVKLAAAHGRPIARDRLIVLEEWDKDHDLTQESGYWWLQERVHAYKPDLLFIGPLYDLSTKDLKDQDVAAKMKLTINAAAAICGTAIVMEHHAPHKEPGAAVRSIRPYGSSIFLKWPDYGFGLKPMEDDESVYQWAKFRYQRVRDRHFPTHFRWGKPNTMEWPWMAAYMDDDGVLHTI